jgi:beta-galactosidase GanA
MLAGELQNSSLTLSKYMAEAWPKLAEANLNTVLGSVTWEQIEPEEDSFDFAGLDECLRGARQSGLRLVVLWFGSFKNGGWWD